MKTFRTSLDRLGRLVTITTALSLTTLACSVPSTLLR